MTGLESKEQALITRLRELAPFAVAFSGGVDCSVILAAARSAAIPGFCAIMAVAPVYPEYELARGREFCRMARIKLIEVEADFFGNAAAVLNDVNRCYYCKKAIFMHARRIAEAEGCRFLVDGTNATDLGEERPGLAACDELGVVHPLLECGLTKTEIRELAHKYGLAYWNDPAAACYATRIPTGTVITLDKIMTVARGESFLRDCGLTGPRLRHHGDIARIELRGDDLQRFTDPAFAKKVSRELKILGFEHVTVDIEGYGGMQG
jgi:pyridinium-3,5-biscarboxylic acid mononucleotide sulfurtransferase